MKLVDKLFPIPIAFLSATNVRLLESMIDLTLPLVTSCSLNSRSLAGCSGFVLTRLPTDR